MLQGSEKFVTQRRAITAMSDDQSNSHVGMILALATRCSLPPSISAVLSQRPPTHIVIYQIKHRERNGGSEPGLALGTNFKQQQSPQNKTYSAPICLSQKDAPILLYPPLPFPSRIMYIHTHFISTIVHHVLIPPIDVEDMNLHKVIKGTYVQ